VSGTKTQRFGAVDRWLRRASTTEAVVEHGDERATELRPGSEIEKHVARVV